MSRLRSVAGLTDVLVRAAGLEPAPYCDPPNAQRSASWLDRAFSRGTVARLRHQAFEAWHVCFLQERTFVSAMVSLSEARRRHSSIFLRQSSTHLEETRPIVACEGHIVTPLPVLNHGAAGLGSYVHWWGWRGFKTARRPNDRPRAVMDVAPSNTSPRFVRACLPSKGSATHHWSKSQT
jgi:hypothetical protein